MGHRSIVELYPLASVTFLDEGVVVSTICATGVHDYTLETVEFGRCTGVLQPSLRVGFHVQFERELTVIVELLLGHLIEIELETLEDEDE